MLRLTTLYKSILESMDVRADEMGFLTVVSGDHSDPIRVSVDGSAKRLVLPMDDYLRKGFPEELVAFHPLSEVSNRGESEVFRKLKLLAQRRLTLVLVEMLENLANLGADKEKHKALSPKLLALLETMPNADQKFVSNVADVIAASFLEGKNNLINIFMRRGGTCMGEKHARVAVVTFPIYEELLREDRKVFGVQLRVKDVAQLKALLEWILPGSDQADTYNAFSDSMDAPYFEALMLAYAKIAAKLNIVQKLAGKHLESGKALHIDLDWVNELKDIDQLRFDIPALEGNKGVQVNSSKTGNAAEALTSRIATAEASPVATVEKNTPAPAPIALTPAAVPAIQTNAVPAVAHGKTMAEILGTSPSQPYVQMPQAVPMMPLQPQPFMGFGAPANPFAAVGQIAAMPAQPNVNAWNQGATAWNSTPTAAPIGFQPYPMMGNDRL